MITPSLQTPPKLLMEFLSILLPPSRRQEVLGDLTEEYLLAPPRQALWRFLYEVVALIPSAVCGSLKACWSPGMAIPAAFQATADVAIVRRKVEALQEANHNREIFYLSFVGLFGLYIASEIILAHAWLPRLILITYSATLSFTAWQHHARGCGRAIPPNASVSELMNFHYRELVRRCDFLRTLWYWKWLPLGSPIVYVIVVRFDKTTILTASWIFACFVIAHLAARNEMRSLRQRLDELDVQRSYLASRPS